LVVLAFAAAAVSAPAASPKPVSTPSSDGPAGVGYIREIGLIPGVRDLGLSPELSHLMRPQNGTTGIADRGLPLGGIGTGSFEINQYGTFGPWSFGSHEMRILPQAAFHIREEVQGSKAKVKTLATSGRLSALPQAWPAIAPGQATYKALYPFGWIDYKSFSAKIAMRFWSPIVAKEDERTSMPVAYFDFRVSNPNKSEDTVSVMFTFPNAPIHVPETTVPNGFAQQPMYLPPSVRTGLTSRYDYDSKTGIYAVTLGASDPSNTVDAQDTDWTIGIKAKPRQRITYVTSWNAEGGAKAIMDAFRQSGDLPNKGLDDSNSAGAIAVTVKLKPGETQMVNLILAWDIPRELYVARSRGRRGFGSPGMGGRGGSAQPPQETGRTVWMKRYTAYFGGRENDKNEYIEGSYSPRQGFNIAKRMLSEHDESLSAVLKWWAPYAENKALPGWLRTAALNQISYNVSGHSFWEAGLVSNTVPLQFRRRIGSITPGTHMFFVDTGSEGGDESALSGDVTPYNYMMWQELFPNLERQILLATTEAIDLAPDPNFGNLGSTDGGSPFITCQAAGRNTYIDHQILYAFRLWKFVRDNKDDELLRIAYPQLLRIYNFQKTTFFTAGDHLPVDGRPNNTHEMRVSGHGIYNCLLWILHDNVMIEATKRAATLGLQGATSAFVSDLQSDLDAAKRDFEDQFWDEARGHYRFDTGKDTPAYRDAIFSDGTYAQHLAQTLGIPCLTDPQRLARHLKAVQKYLVEPFRGADGYVVGAINLLTNDYSMFPPLKPGDEPIGGSTPREALEVWLGVSFPLAALMMATAANVKDAELDRYGRELGEGTAHQIWTKYENGHVFRVPEGWRALDPGHHRDPAYGRALPVWDLLDAWRDFGLRMATGPQARPAETSH